LNEVLRVGKDFLEETLQPIDPDYRCYVFRAANWAVNPSTGIVRALLNNDFKIDTSVFKYGRRDGVVNFDYSNAPSEIVPWFASRDDICQRDDTSGLLDVPIYCEQCLIGSFLSVNRIYRAYLSRRHAFGEPASRAFVAKETKAARVPKFLKTLFRKHPRKADFNQCSGKQLVNSLKRAHSRHRSEAEALPFVLIGHSKLFTRQNEKALLPLLQFVANTPDKYSFGMFPDDKLPKRKTELQAVASLA
jgi:hypothetical protein